MELVLAIAVGLLGSVVTAVFLQRRHTRKVRTLLSRLEELEAVAGPV